MMRLLCDEMLARLARWLRAAGHDTTLARCGEADASLLLRAGRDDRLVLTRDRELARRRAGRGRVVVLAGESLDAQARELGRRLDLDWLHAPLSRCLMDNTPVRPAHPAEVAALPAGRPGIEPPFNACPRCGRVFWDGGHARRIRARLRAWQQAAPG